MRGFIFSISIALILTSCSVYKNIDVQFYNNADKDFPDLSNGVVILSNLGIKNSQSKQLLYDWTLDSVASAEATHGLQNIMQTSPLYGNLNLSVDYYNRTEASNFVLPLRWEVLEEISKRNGGANVIISLDYIDVTPKYDCYPTLQGDFMNYYGYLQIDGYYYWRIYNLSTKKTSNTFLNRDTLIWEKNDWVQVRPGEQLPLVFEAAAYAGFDAAKQYSIPYIPVWQNSSRLIYNKGNKAMEKAYSMAINGEWINAAGIWQTMVNSSCKKIASRAAFNMALASEMLDRFEIAMQWLIKSYELNPSLEGIHEYQHILEDRIVANKRQ